MKNTLAAALAACWLAGAADFTYTEKTQVTGGSMKTAMDMAARFSKSASMNTETVHRIKGDKMMSQTGQSAQIFDVAAGTVTAIDFNKREYSVVTFAEMAEAMKKLQAKMGGKDGLTFNVTAENTGQKKAIQGVQAAQHIIKVTVTGAKQGSMDVTLDSFMGAVPGSEAVAEFGKRVAGMMAGGASAGPVNLQGLGEARKKMAEIGGLPLYQVARIGGGMLETTTEIVSWSPAAVDAAAMSVPAGFKQVEHPLKKLK